MGRALLELGALGRRRRARHAELHHARARARGVRPAPPRPGDLVRAALRRQGSAERCRRPLQPDPPHARHRRRRGGRRAGLPARRLQLRGRRGDDAAPVRHAVGRARTRLLRRPHVRRSRREAGDQPRRAQELDRCDCERRGRARRAARSTAHHAAALARGRHAHPARAPRRLRRGAGRDDRAGRHPAGAHRHDDALPRAEELGGLLRRSGAGPLGALRALALRARARRRWPPTPGASR